MKSDENIIPLFPLNTVVFPEGRLKLRIFEKRYVDMVGFCMRESLPFGIVPIAEGNEAGEPANIYSVGTGVHIVDFEKMDDGLLGITVCGQDRFEVCEHWNNPDKLKMGEIDWLSPMPPSIVDASHEPLVALLRQLFPQMQQDYGYTEAYFDRADWVMGRLIEVLPLPVGLKADLLSLDDPEPGLAVLNEVLSETSGVRDF